ncbi:MAG TPA: penicillin-binding protein activator, partial [Novosphingobium sp.]
MFGGMFGGKFDRRGLIAGTALALLAGCAVVPKAPQVAPPPERPNANALPADQLRHRVALLVPLSGTNGGVGQSLANATTMALLDTSATSLRITTYDTAMGAAAAASRAVADGNKLILGPLLGEEARIVSQVARPARVPVISFSNDISVASPGTFIMGSLPGQSIARTVRFARAQGLSRFAMLVPEGEYGQRASAAFRTAVADSGGTL